MVRAADLFLGSGLRLPLFCAPRRPKADTISTSLKLLRITAFVVGIASAFSCGKEFFGDPIQCVFEEKIYTKEFVNTFCWFNATTTVDTNDEVVGRRGQASHPGVRTTAKDESPSMVLSYYQWVPLVLCLQGFAFYMPYRLWKSGEGGKIDDLVRMANKDDDERGHDNSSSSSMYDGASSVGRYLAEHFGTYKGYAARYIFCEVLALICVIVQLCLMDWMLNGDFSSLGLRWLRHDPDSLKTAPLVRLFPRVTKCMLHHYSISGQIMDVAALCILPLNIINEKIYLLFWFWLVVTAALLICHLAGVLFTVTSSFPRGLMLRNRSPTSRPEIVGTVNACAGYADFLVVNLLIKNLKEDQRVRILRILARHLMTIDGHLGVGAGGDSHPVRFEKVADV